MTTKLEQWKETRDYMYAQARRKTAELSVALKRVAEVEAICATLEAEKENSELSQTSTGTGET